MHDDHEMLTTEIDDPRLTPLVGERIEPTVPWFVARPIELETYRWESGDRDWITVSVCRGAELGSMEVARAGNRRAVVDDFEDALTLALLWRS